MERVTCNMLKGNLSWDQTKMLILLESIATYATGEINSFVKVS